MILPLTICPICESPITDTLESYPHCMNCDLMVKSLAFRLTPEKTNRTFNWHWVHQHYYFEPCRPVRADYTFNVLKSLKNLFTTLDIGCGSGLLVDTLSHANFKSTGLDNSPQAISFAQEHCAGDFICGTIDDIKDKYDAITICHLLEHMSDPTGFLRKVKYILNPLGFLYIAVPNLYSFHHAPATALVDPTHLTAFSKKSLAITLRKSGYKILKLETKSVMGFEDKKNRFGRLAYDTLKIIKGSNGANESLKQPARKLGLRFLFRIVSKSHLLKFFSYLLCLLYDWQGKGEEVIALAVKKEPE